ncbi:NB-ARC domain-containing protein [Iningainema tapete]|uniref:NACHT domain-containing protein n=1 Tax=Iningainema tapete BLCC-T55 TaxID=2748662 RepID=A0A8J7BYZ2_9CYAN|nr:NB-ARC domain-containing protein [Iningainema tapete]MBD2776597.1 NACHT domain-containing protein [Iningainema tapete BLCC-T55]
MDKDEFTLRFQELSPKPRKVLKLLLEGNTDDEIAQAISATPATVRKHVQNLCDRFGIRSEIAGLKLNRREELIVLVGKYKPELVSDRFRAIIAPVLATTTTVDDTPNQPHQDWGDAPDPSVLFETLEDHNTLKEWILQDHCRIVALLGMGGIGKTSLSVKLAQQIENEFEFIIWRSLRNAPPLTKLLTELINFLSRGQNILSQDVNITDKISILIEYLQKSRCLVILDNWHTILSPGDFAGHYKKDYKDYGQLLNRLGKQSHQSCLLLTSRETPREIPVLQAETVVVRTLEMQGSQKVARQILKDKKLSGEAQWGTLINVYRCNPLALKIVSKTIQELFDNDVAKFLAQSLTYVLRDIRILIEDQVNRLSELGKKILYWLAIQQKPATLEQLQESLCASKSVLPSDLIVALESLKERSLIETHKENSTSLFTLQPVVMEYIRDEIVKQVSQEIYEASLQASEPEKILNKLNLLRNHALKESQSDISEGKLTSIISLIKARLYTYEALRNQNTMIDSLNQIKSYLESKSKLEVGYAVENLYNLLEELKKNDI